MDNEKKPTMLSIRQAAATGVLPERTIRRLVAQGKIPHIKSGRTQYINYDNLIEALQSGKGKIWE
jgi:excisionase family DNA binding protein